MTTLAHLCLGTASWNQEAPYNGRTPPDDAELRRILDVAEAGGIRWIDTAVAYGNVEQRLANIEAWERFKIVSKVRAWPPPPLLSCPAAVLNHLGPTEPFAGAWWPREEGLDGASVYTVAQAAAALDAEVQVLQVPWNVCTANAEWILVRERAYADGVLFFGRQPFSRGEYVCREHFEFALETNPRGWCVVGVETASQLQELIAWREAL